MLICVYSKLKKINDAGGMADAKTEDVPPDVFAHFLSCGFHM